MEDPRRPVASFLVLVFALSVPFWLLGATFGVQLIPGLPLSSLVAFTPGLAAVVLSFRAGRLPAVRHTLGRALDGHRIQARAWYLVVVLFPPTVAVIAYAALRVTGVDVPPPAAPGLDVVLLFVAFFAAALAEEIGWTGHATDPLLDRWGVLPAGCLLGLVWVLFHLVPLMQAGRAWEWTAWWSLATVTSRTVMVWLHRHAGRSVFAAAVFHTMINVSWRLFPVDGSFYDPRAFGLATLALALLLIAARSSALRATGRAG